MSCRIRPVDTTAAYAEGFPAYYSGRAYQARDVLTDVAAELRQQHRLALEVEALFMLGLCHAMCGSAEQANECYVRVLEITESSGESVARSYAQWATGLLEWQHREFDRATQLLDEALQRLARLIVDPVGTAMCLEALAWIACDTDDPERAAVLTGAAGALATAAGNWPILSPNLLTSHTECVRRAIAALGDAEFATARRAGEDMSGAAAVALALGE
ncbi:hypothetical protein [Nocardia sp. NPDC059239]|uniref:hypothetical protein n=1 Tax=unclassified Nocardia TaxID=2637762 RepID=UPI003675E481